METKAHHVLVGFFTLVVVLAMMGFAVWLGRPGGDVRQNMYDIVFDEAVTGLTKGSTVEFNGIKVGDIYGLRLDTKDPRHVIARVRVDANAPVRTDTQARLVQTSVTGPTVIRLTSGDAPDSKPLQSSDNSVPVIIAKPSPLSKLLTSGEDVAYNLNLVVMQMRNLFSPENMANIQRTLDNVAKTTDTLAAERENMGKTLRELAQASTQANKALADAASIMRSGKGMMDQEVRGSVQSAQRAMDHLEQTMQTVQQVVDNNHGALDSGLHGVSEVGPALTELRDTLGSLKMISRQLEERPADFLLKREPPREFTP